MNNERRKKLSALVKTVDGMLADLNCVLNEEQDAYENIPESLQDGDIGVNIGLAIDELELAKNALTEFKFHLLDAAM